MSFVSDLSYLLRLDPPRCDGPKEKFIAKVEGSTVLIPCDVRGNPPPKIEWSKNGVAVEEGRLTSTTKGLTIKALRRGDSGSYQVTLSSIAGTFAHVTELIVKSTQHKLLLFILLCLHGLFMQEFSLVKVFAREG